MEAGAGIDDEPLVVSDLDFEPPLEDEDEVVEIPDTRRNVYTQQADPEIEALHGNLKQGRLVIQPEFQTNWRLDNKRASRLIESTLLEIPLPTIYLSEDKEVFVMRNGKIAERRAWVIVLKENDYR